MVIITLISDVLFHRFLRTVRADRADVISVRPELAAPQLLFDFRHLPKDFFGGDALDGSHDFRRTIHRHRLQQKMHMVRVGSDCPTTRFRSADLFLCIFL